VREQAGHRPGAAGQGGRSRVDSRHLLQHAAERRGQLTGDRSGLTKAPCCTAAVPARQLASTLSPVTSKRSRAVGGARTAKRRLARRRGTVTAAPDRGPGTHRRRRRSTRPGPTRRGSYARGGEGTSRAGSFPMIRRPPRSTPRVVPRRRGASGERRWRPGW
jgi:hypothetical protein